MKASLLLVLLFAAAPSSAATTDQLNKIAIEDIADPELQAKTLQCLRARNADYDAMAEDYLTAEGERFDIQRVEITGVYSDDDTNPFMPLHFEKQAKPSYKSHDKPSDAGRRQADKILAGGDKGGSGRLIRDGIALGSALRFAEEDIKEFGKAARGELTPRVRETLAPYANKEINEIVTHSWGCEAVFAAILHGLILPPKKLILTGPADNDTAKWELLANRTGMEVHWARATNDTVGNYLGPTVARIMERPVDVAAILDAQCGPTCNRYNRPTRAINHVNVGQLEGFLGHERQAYYEFLKRADVVSLDGTSKKVIDGTLTELKQRHETMKEPYIARALAAVRLLCLTEAQEAIAKADRDRGVATPIKEREIAVAKPETAVARPIPTSEFGQAMPDIARYARESCASPGSAAHVYINYYRKPYLEYFGRTENWRREFDTQWHALSGCSRDLFFEIVTMALNQETWRIYERGWLEERVARFSPPSGVDVPPSNGNGSGGGQRWKSPDHNEVWRRLEKLR